MKQLIQNLRTGVLKVEEVPPPALKAGGVLVRNFCSVVSIGTERSTVITAQRSLVGKAKNRPDLVKEVIDNIRKEGIISTHHKVMNRLDTPKPLGYSSAGVVIEVADDVDEFERGDRVACAGGGYASHAEVVFVPKNLCVPIPPEVDLKDAAFTTLGAIGMQSVRQADVAVADSVAVIGLGLVGLLTVQILKSSGCRVIGLDVDPDALVRGRELGADIAILSDDPKVETLVKRFTGGYGVDRVIITAATSSNQPVEIGGRIARDRGIIVIVGAIRMDIPRDLYYGKELVLKLSRSYGPGRYDSTYEERGVDYPIGYVRWTEKRNMLAFLQLVAEKKVNAARMITHVFPIEQASRVYQIITNKTDEKYLAILLDYNYNQDERALADLESRVYLEKESGHTIALEGQLNVGFIGAGNFARDRLLPPLKGIKGIRLKGVATARGVTSRNVAERFGFAYCTSDHTEILEDSEIQCVFIATRHNLHANLVVQALEHGKHVFVEKPLALSEEELNTVMTAYQKNPGQLMAGFNRRFSPLIKETKQFFRSLQKPVVINYRVNAGSVPKNHWTQDPLEGGGRILGEVCHFVDLIQYLTDAVPIKVYARSIASERTDIVDSDNVNITLKFDDGSLGIISYVALGDPRLGKERIEIFGDNCTVVIEDFRAAEFYRNGKVRKFKSRGKGHQEEVEAFISALKESKPSPIPFQSLALTTITTLKIKESLNKDLPIDISYPQAIDKNRKP